MNDKDRERNERIARDAQRRKDERTQRAMDEAAAAEERAGSWSDDLFDKGMQDVFGASMKDIQRSYDKTKDEKGEVKRILDKASKMSHGSKRSQRKAIGLVKANKSKVKKATKKSGWGCAIVGVMMLGAFGGLGYGLYEGAAALIGVA